MLVMGIDPGIATMGYGFVRELPDGQIEAVEFGVITTPPDLEIASRLQLIYQHVSTLLKMHAPNEAAIEKLLFGKNVTTAMAVGQARGVAILALADSGVAIQEFTPAIIKQTVAGYGNASKVQVQEMVRMLLNLEKIPRPDDAADALAVAITHLFSSRYRQLESL